MLEGVEELLVVLVGLVSELVAGEGEDVELVAILLGQGIRRSEVPDRRAS